ncbi:MAG: EpsG family protein [Clostridia bacterium]|nr:EpsG family protein [Clostridia bacterium]
MGIYLINLLLIIVLGFVFIHTNPSDAKKKVYCGICATQWILLSTLRDYSVGNDTREYEKAFTQSFERPWSEIIDTCWRYLIGQEIEGKDPGYYLLQKIFQIFFDDYRMWLFFIAVLFTGLMARWIYKYSSMPDISFVVYSVLFFAFYSVTGHRQTLATALIVFLGYEFAKKRQLVKFAIVAFIAFMLHKSSLVFIIYYFVAALNITSTYGIMLAGITVVIGVLGKRLYGPIALALGFADEQVDYAGGGAETFATVLILLCLVAYIFYPWISKKRTDAKYIYNMISITLVCTVLVYQNQSFMRIQQYFSLIIMIIIPEIIQAFDKNYRVLAYLFVVIFLGLYFIRLNPKYSFFFT